MFDVANLLLRPASKFVQDFFARAFFILPRLKALSRSLKQFLCCSWALMPRQFLVTDVLPNWFDQILKKLLPLVKHPLHFSPSIRDHGREPLRRGRKAKVLTSNEYTTSVGISKGTTISTATAKPVFAKIWWSRECLSPGKNESVSMFQMEATRSSPSWGASDYTKRCILHGIEAQSGSSAPVFPTGS